MSIMKILASGGIKTPTGQQAYTTPGTYPFIVPDGVETLCAVAVGGGGGGGRIHDLESNPGHSGAGGALSYSNDIPVTPGETLWVTVGAGGLGTDHNTISATDGGDSYIQRGGVDILRAKGGSKGVPPGSGEAQGGDASQGVGDVRRSGGNSGDSSARDRTGPGGAAGYSGDGGRGVSTGGGGVISATAGSGGGGGGGFSSEASGYQAPGAGGVGILGEGASGGPGSSVVTASGKGGSAGEDGKSGNPSSRIGGNGGDYGGGAGFGVASSTSNGGGGVGGKGAVRIIWGTNRSFPSTNTGDF